MELFKYIQIFTKSLLLGVLLQSCSSVIHKPPSISVSDLMISNNEHLLMEPIGDARGLLGREVRRQSGGGYVIADALAPGCEVGVREVLSKWTRTYTQEAGKVAGFSADIVKIAMLKAKYKKGVRIRVRVRNLKVINADIRGTCGEQVVTSVKVGIGKRDFEYREDWETGARGGWKVIPIEGGGGSFKHINASLEWDTPQAWAFTIGKVKDANQAEITIHMPGELKPGQRFTPKITAGKQDLWLIVISCYSDSKCVVLRPSIRIPPEVVPAGKTIKLWPMEAVAAKDGQESREKMIVYGFPQEGDFKRFAPPRGVLSLEQSTKYANELRRRLVDQKEIPARRWTMTEFHYIVKAVPKANREE